MVIVIVRWYIKHNREIDFKRKWLSMTPTSSDRLFLEFFSIPHFTDKPKYHTLDLENPHYKTFINVGIWKSVEDFDEAIGKYIPDPVPDKEDPEKVNFSIFDFEFKMRERLVVEVELTRGGKWDLPKPDIVDQEKEINNIKKAEKFFKASGRV